MNTEINIPVAALKAVLPGLSKVVPRHTALPVLQCVRIALEAEGKAITLQAHNLDEVVAVRLENTSGGRPGQVLVPFELLNAIIKSCPAEQSFGFLGGKDQTTLRYRVGASAVDRAVSYIAPKEWPEVKVIPQEPIALEEGFKAALKEAIDCASRDSSRYVLNGACLDVSDNASHCVVGTDGRHLFSSNSFHFTLPESLIIPTRKFLTWSGFVNDGPWKLRLLPAVRSDPANKEKTDTNEQEQPAWFQIQSDRWSYTAKAIDGTFPNWRQCLPKVAKDWTHVELAPAAVQAILEALPLLPGADHANGPVSLHVAEGCLTLRARGQDQPDDTRVPIGEVQVNGKPVYVSLNRGYLMKALRFGFNLVHIHRSLDPVVFTKPGESLVVMPLRTETEPDPAEAPSPDPDYNSVQVTPEPIPPETPPAALPSAPGAVIPTEIDRNRNSMTENTMMPSRGNPKTPPSANGTNGNGNSNGEEPHSPFKPIQEQLDRVKAGLRQAMVELGEACSALKAAEREQRTTTKEIAAVRAKLRDLQSVAI